MSKVLDITLLVIAILVYAIVSNADGTATVAAVTGMFPLALAALAQLAKAVNFGGDGHPSRSDPPVDDTKCLGGHTTPPESSV